MLQPSLNREAAYRETAGCLSTAQNEQDLKDALDDFYSAVQQGVDTVARVAGKAPAAGNQTTTGVKWSIEK